MQILTFPASCDMGFVGRFQNALKMMLFVGKSTTLFFDTLKSFPLPLYRWCIAEYVSWVFRGPGFQSHRSRGQNKRLLRDTASIPSKNPSKTAIQSTQKARY